MQTAFGQSHLSTTHHELAILIIPMLEVHGGNLDSQGPLSQLQCISLP